MYRLAEQFEQGKQDDAHCEDGFVLTPGYVAVIDGSTSKGDYNWGTKTSGQVARDLISDTLTDLSPTACVEEACAQFSSAINKYTREITGKDAEDLPACNRLTASVIIYNDKLKEIWQIGDCPCLIDGILHDNSKPEEAVLSRKRARIIKEALLKGTSIESVQENDVGRSAILNDLRQSCEGQNKRFALIDGTPVLLQGVRVTNVSAAKEIVLASDGYPHLCATLAQSEQVLKRQLQTDPLCINTFMATKGLRPGFHSFDDRTYLRLEL